MTEEQYATLDGATAEEIEALDAWDVGAPPPDFAQLVLRRFGRRRTRWRPIVVATAAGIAVLAAGWLSVRLTQGTRDLVRGHVLAPSRTSIQLGHRGIAVAEGGAEIAWTVVPSGAAEVVQPRGRVFYRVEPGGGFLVKTPAGSVRVVGTSFEVEVKRMKAGRAGLAGAGAVAGAAAATFAVITVYEGEALCVSGDERLPAKAGQRVGLASAAAPRRLSDRLDSLEPDGMARDDNPGADLVAERAELSRRIQSLEEQLRFQRWMMESLSRNLEGEAMPWPEEMPAAFKPQGFAEAMREVAEDCRLESEIISTDCSEPPCLVVARMPEGIDAYDELVACPSWTERYGRMISIATDSIDCPKDRTDRIVSIGPVWEGWETYGPAVKDNLSRRFARRWREIRESWHCAE